MQVMKRLMVCLDQTEMDEHILQYASMLTETLQCQRVYFIHVIKGKETKGDPFKDSMATDKEMEKIIAGKVDMHFKAQTEKKVVIKKGNSVKKIIRFAHLNRIEMIILGKKPLEESSKVHASRITNTSRCSVMLVPAKAQYKIDKMMIPVDFSRSSKMALGKALEIHENNQAEVLLQHVYFVPSGYHSSGKSYDEFAAIMEKNARNEYRKFMKGNGFDMDSFDITYTLDDDAKPSDRIYKVGKEQGVDLIVLASRGRTPAAAFLLGSTAVGLIKYNDDIPYLIVKNKKENLGLFEAIGRL